MAGLGGHLKSLRGKNGRGRRYGGWFRAEADGMIRGWVIDEADPSRHAEIEARIDDRPIGRALADRLDPTLLEQGRGDGRYGFALLIPAALRDGRVHKAEVVTADTGYRLLSKAAEFQIAPALAPPALRLLDIGPEGVRGRFRGARPATPPRLELWTGGRRTREFDTSWTRKGPDLEFRIGWDGKTFAELSPDATLATPGMVETGVGGVRLLDRLRLLARLAPEGLGLTLEGPYRASIDNPLEGKVVAAATRELLGEAGLHNRAATMALPPRARLDQLHIYVGLGGHTLNSVPVELDLSAAQMVANAGFSRWDGQAPRGWETELPREQLSRGFATLPEARTHGLALGGDLVRLQPQASAQARPLLSQSLASLPTGFERQGQAALTCLARAGAPLSLEVRLTGPVGEVLQSMAVSCDEPWSWRREDRSVDLDGLPDRQTVNLELWLTSAPPVGVTIEVAALGLAGEGRFGEAPSVGDPDNFLEQGAFEHWPHGVSPTAAGGRREIAEGWFVHNRGSTGVVLARAAPLEHGAALLLSAAEVADYCRLEARLDPAAAGGGAFRLGFLAGAPSGVSTAFQSAAAFNVIDRIFVLHRGSPTENVVVAQVARRVPVERQLGAYTFGFNLPEALDNEAGELFLAFDFAGPFALRLQDVRITRAGAEDAAPELALEDSAIAVQAKTLKGLSQWLSPEVVRPGPRFDGASGVVLCPNLRWSSPAPGHSTVEVVVCVHDAAEETLACLRSLGGTTTVPHMVLIVDDASGEDTRRRIEGFIADKPWMRMVSNDRNLGYTASANLGIRASAGEWVVLLNSDTVATSGWLEGLLECAAATGASFVGPISNAASYQSVPELKDRRGRWKTNALPPGWTPEKMATFVRENAEKSFPAAPLLNGFCTLIRREAFLQLGGFNQAAFPQGYGEENDLCVRAAQSGHKLAVADHVYVHHAKSASFGGERRAELQKQAAEALKRLHPDVDFTALGDRIREAQPLVHLRAAVRALYEAQA